MFAARHVSFGAHDGPNGPSGAFTSHTAGPAGDFTGEVTCLLVQGNRAVIGGTVRHARIAANEGTGFEVAVEDNGQLSDTPPDRVSAYFLGIPPPGGDCAGGVSLYSTLAPITSGNIRVNP